jgi:antitoxin (DNA-binding transcriptional repressor) of toxin-antitoxin stability system
MAREISVDYFVARPIELIEEAAAKQEELLILKDGKPFVRVVPTAERSRKMLEQMRAEGVKILGDIVEL